MTAMQDVLDTAARVLPGGVLGSFRLPDEVAFVPARASGCHLETMDGVELIDHVLGGGPMILGHAHPAVVEAVTRRIADGTQFYSYLNEPAVALAEKLTEAVPCAELVRFATSGSEATMYALRLARAHTGRDRIVKFEGAYHGNHDAAMLSTWPRQLGQEEGTFDSAGVPGSWLPQVSIAAFNDLESVARVLERHPDEVAAVIVEPFQRFLTPAPGFLEGVRDLCAEHGALLVFDEVVTGFRLGWGGAQERWGVTPDLATYGKIVGGGFPLSAICGRGDVLERTNPVHKGSDGFVYQSGTLNGHPIATAAGLATLAVLEETDAYAVLDHAGSRLRTGLSKLFADRGVEATVVGETGMWHVLFGTGEPQTVAEAARADVALLKRWHIAMIARGVFVLPGLRAYLSTAHDDDAIDRTLDIAADALDETTTAS